jgi:hypothetical protein
MYILCRPKRWREAKREAKVNSKNIHSKTLRTTTLCIGTLCDSIQREEHSRHPLFQKWVHLADRSVVSLRLYPLTSIRMPQRFFHPSPIRSRAVGLIFPVRRAERNPDPQSSNMSLQRAYGETAYYGEPMHGRQQPTVAATAAQKTDYPSDWAAYYDASQAATGQGRGAVASAPAAAAPAHDAYYNVFLQHAAYHGEEAARMVSSSRSAWHQTGIVRSFLSP